MCSDAATQQARKRARIDDKGPTRGAKKMPGGTARVRDAQVNDLYQRLCRLRLERERAALAGASAMAASGDDDDDDDIAAADDASMSLRLFFQQRPAEFAAVSSAWCVDCDFTRVCS